MKNSFGFKKKNENTEYQIIIPKKEGEDDYILNVGVLTKKEVYEDENTFKVLIAYDKNCLYMKEKDYIELYYKHNLDKRGFVEVDGQTYVKLSKEAERYLMRDIENKKKEHSMRLRAKNRKEEDYPFKYDSKIYIQPKFDEENKIFEFEFDKKKKIFVKNFKISGTALENIFCAIAESHLNKTSLYNLLIMYAEPHGKSASEILVARSKSKTFKQKLEIVEVLKKYPFYKVLGEQLHFEEPEKFSNDLKSLYEAKNEIDFAKKIIPAASKKNMKIFRELLEKEKIYRDEAMKYAINAIIRCEELIFFIVKKPETLNNLLEMMKNEQKTIVIDYRGNYAEKKIVVEEIFKEGAIDNYVNAVCRDKQMTESEKINTIEQACRYIKDICKMKERFDKYGEPTNFNTLSEKQKQLFESIQKQFGKVTKIKKFHDELSIVCDKLVMDYKEFEYKKEVIERYTWKKNSYEFKMPKNNFELIDIGKEMKHCVGSYAEEILYNGKYIVNLYKNGESVITMEIEEGYGDDHAYILQAKKKYNKNIKQEEKELIKVISDYIKRAKLNVDTNDLDVLYA